MNKKKDIIYNILVGQSDDFDAQLEELNCMIYKNAHEPAEEGVQHLGHETWQSAKENVTVQVSEDKARIKVKISFAHKKTISMKRIADVAVDAILKELKKGE